jgi:outer membrane protein assembly factor BamB
VTVARVPAKWLRRGFLAAVLVGAAIIPGRAVSQQASCGHGTSCRVPGSILWKRGLPGSWVAQPGVVGTVPDQAEAYVAVGGQVAMIGFGTTVAAFRADSGQRLWDVSLAGLPAGSVISSLGAWPGAVAVGITPAASGQPAIRSRPAGRHLARNQPAGPEVVILSAATGRELRAYPSAASGGAVAADAARTVVVGPHAVISYHNATGGVAWRQPIGSVPQAWRVGGPYLYVAVTSGGYLRSSPVTALRRISLRSGAERIVRGPFAGTLSGVVGDVLLFSGNGGVYGYSASTGALLWHQPSYVPEFIDPGQQVVYLTSGAALVGVDAASGNVVSRQNAPLTSSLYEVRDGVALGLDQGALGEAWGYNLAKRRVIWNSGPLPWPHYFVDLSGLGGSASSSSGVTLLVICADVGPASPAGSGPACRRPELAAVEF